MNELDAKRYLRLAYLVETGEWSVGKHEIIDKFGRTDDTYMDDKAELDKYLDELGEY